MQSQTTYKIIIYIWQLYYVRLVFNKLKAKLNMNNFTELGTSYGKKFDNVYKVWRRSFKIHFADFTGRLVAGRQGIPRHGNHVVVRSFDGSNPNRHGCQFDWRVRMLPKIVHHPSTTWPQLCTIDIGSQPLRTLPGAPKRQWSVLERIAIAVPGYPKQHPEVYFRLDTRDGVFHRFF